MKKHPRSSVHKQYRMLEERMMTSLGLVLDREPREASPQEQTIIIKTSSSGVRYAVRKKW